MSKILDLKEKSQQPNPLIEIQGPIDIGKTPIAQLVARRLKATFIPFPILDPYTVTGRALLSSLTQTPRGLESHPYWWAHIYAANLYEHCDKIRVALVSGPVITTNYVRSYILWMRSAGIDVEGFIKDLPSVSMAFMLSGLSSIPTTRPKFNFSPEFIYKVQRSMAHVEDKKSTRILLSSYENKFTHMFVNSISIDVSLIIADKYSLKIKEKELYTKESFMLKKDLT